MLVFYGIVSNVRDVFTNYAIDVITVRIYSVYRGVYQGTVPTELALVEREGDGETWKQEQRDQPTTRRQRAPSYRSDASRAGLARTTMR